MPRFSSLFSNISRGNKQKQQDVCLRRWRRRREKKLFTKRIQPLQSKVRATYNSSKCFRYTKPYLIWYEYLWPSGGASKINVPANIPSPQLFFYRCTTPAAALPWYLSHSRPSLFIYQNGDSSSVSICRYCLAFKGQNFNGSNGKDKSSRLSPASNISYSNSKCRFPPSSYFFTI